MRRLLIWTLLLMLAGCATVGSSSFKKAEELYRAGAYDQAIVAYADAAEKNPDKAEYRMRLHVARHKAALKHEKQGDELLARRDYHGALREYRIANGLDASIESSLVGAREAERYIKATDLILEASKLLRDRHFKQSRQLVDEALLTITDYPPALELRKELDKHVTTMIDGIELEVSSNDPITLNFKAASLPDVFDILTQLSGIHFILDEAIRSQTTTLYLEGATFAQAFELLLRMNKLANKVLNSKTIIVFPNSKDKKKQFSDQIIQTFYLSNIDAKKAVNLLRTMLQVRKIYVHEELNAIVLRDKPEVIRLAQKIIEATDLSTSEVVFDLELVEVSHQKLLDIGPKLSTYSVQVGANGVPLVNADTNKITNIVVDDLKNLTALYGIPFATFDFMKQNGDAEILASPKIRVKNKGKAKVHIGSREPVVTVTINDRQTSENVQYVDVGVKLDVEPVIQLDNTIVTKLGLEVSNVSDRSTTSNGTAVLTISTTNATTELILKDGERTIIGGLLRDAETKTRTGIPVLMDIPLIGPLFTSYSKQNLKREILLSITPHIVRSVRLPESGVASIWSGGEDDLRVGRNFGSFAAQYVEEQGKTPTNAAPGLQTRTEQVNQPNPAEAIAEALMAQQEPEAAQLLNQTQPVVTGTVAPPVSPSAMLPVSGSAPTITAPEPFKPPVVSPSPATIAPAGAPPVPPSASPAVPEVLLTGLPTPETVVRPSIFIEGDRLTTVGSEFTLTLSVQDVKNLFSAPLYIRYDPKLVKFVRASEGSFLKQGGSKTIFTSTLMSDSGRVIVGLKQGAGSQGASGGGKLAQLVFKAKAPGKLSIAPERINFRNPAGERLPIDSRGLIIEVK